MRKVKTKKILSFILIGGLFSIALSGQSHAKMEAMPAGARLQNKTIEKLFWYSGLNSRYQEVESFLGRNKNIDPVALKPSQIGFAKNLMHHSHGPGVVRATLKKNFLARFDQNHAEASIKWFKSPAAQRILKAESEAHSHELKKEREKFIKEIMVAPPVESRLLVMERIMAEEAFPENVRALFLAYVDSMYPFNDSLQGRRLVKVVRRLKNEKTGVIHEQVRLQKLFAYREIRERDLKAYARFLESPEGRWFTFTESQGFEKGIKRIMSRVHKVQRKLLLEIEDGGPEFPLLRELAPPGQRYLLVRLRDPFKPLFTDAGPVQTEASVSASKARQFGGELEDIPPISLYVMNKIEKKRPALFRKLRHYKRLFNNRENLKEMGDDEYADAIEEYRTVLEKASETKVSKTPLQAEYENLKLTGIISKDTKTLALVETADHKGHVVDKGDLIGPRFGFVDEVQPEKIIVIEKSRDYLGNILTRQRTIEFAQKI